MELPRRSLFLLQRFEVVTKISDPLANSGFVIVLQVLEDRSPDGHFRGAVRGEDRAKTQNGFHVLVREFAIVALGKGGEIGDPRVQRGSGRPAALGISAVARSAILFEHGFARRHIPRRQLRFVVFAGS